ncbi:MAG TPA: helix-turn-helix domain-containing protein [Candidatus Latescibacteria bacterium]|nr:helix-turn-helix domain-containing protein [Candidatus Latescibacterota bacterium]
MGVSDADKSTAGANLGNRVPLEPMSERESKTRPFWEAHIAFYGTMGAYVRGRFDPSNAVLEAVFFRIVSYADAEGRAWPKTAEIAKRLKLGHRTVANALEHLVRLGVLGRQRRHGGAGKGRGALPTVYTITDRFRFRTTKGPLLRDQNADVTRPPVPPNNDEPRCIEPIPFGSSKAEAPDKRVVCALSKPKAPPKMADPGEESVFVAFWDEYPDCRYKKGNFVPAWEQFQKERSDPRFNLDNVLAALRESVYTCDDLDYFPKPQNWLKRHPWIGLTMEPRADRAKEEREMLARKADERIAEKRKDVLAWKTR